MGMYSNLIEKSKSFKVDEDKLTSEYGYEGENLVDFFIDHSEVKFYGYWNDKYIAFLDEISRKGYVKGTCVVEYEDPDTPLIECKFSKDGFNYRYAEKPVFQNWERKIIVKPHLKKVGNKIVKVKAHIKKVKDNNLQKFNTEALAKKYVSDMNGMGEYRQYNYSRKGKTVYRKVK